MSSYWVIYDMTQTKPLRYPPPFYGLILTLLYRVHRNVLILYLSSFNVSPYFILYIYWLFHSKYSHHNLEYTRLIPFFLLPQLLELERPIRMLLITRIVWILCWAMTLSYSLSQIKPLWISKSSFLRKYFPSFLFTFWRIVFLAEKLLSQNA